MAEVTPEAPLFDDNDGSENDVLYIPVVEGVEYYRDGVLLENGTLYSASGTVTITTVPTSGYTFPVGATTEWVYTYKTGTAVTPQAPAFTDTLGTTADTYTVPNQTGVVYFANGVVAQAGSHPGSGTVVITATPDTGYFFPDGAVVEWTHAFDTSAGPDAMVVSAYHPNIVDMANASTGDSYTIPSITGVRYKVNGVHTLPGKYTAPVGEVHFEAEAEAGYILAEDSESYWVWTFEGEDPPLPVVRSVIPIAPDFIDSQNTEAYDQFGIPTQSGISYYIDGNAEPTDAGYYVGKGSVTITARAWENFYIPAGVTQSWRHNFSGAPAPSTVAAWTNTGTAPVHATFVVYGPIPKTGFTISDRVSGNVIVWRGSLTGLPAVIDSREGTVRVGWNYDFVQRLIVSQFTTINPGQRVEFELRTADDRARMKVQVAKGRW